MVFGGWLVKRLKMTNIQIAAACTAFSVLGCAFITALVTHCGTPSVVGVNAWYVAASKRAVAKGCTCPLTAQCCVTDSLVAHLPDLTQVVLTTRIWL